MAIAHRPESDYRHWKAEEVKLIGDRAVRYSDVCVHEFAMGDVEDPELYAAEPLWQWQQSEAGQWAMEHAVEKPYWIQSLDYNSWGHKFKVMARLSEQDQTFWILKWGGINK
jgi:hypothetical protein